MFDAYAHVGVPRFLSPKHYLGLMAQHGIEKALVCPFDACPDIASVHRAVGLGAGRIVGLGLALGTDDAEIRHNTGMQLDAGLIGVRFSEADVLERGEALDVMGERGGLSLVVGERGLGRIAERLVEHLERFDTALVVAAHFAGPMPVDSLSAASKRLIEHPRFSVVFSRQGYFDPDVLAQWSAMLLNKMGWERIMWGSEAPVLFWRDEPMAATPTWIDRFSPNDAQLETFFQGTADRVIFQRKPQLRSLDLPFDPFDFDPGRGSPFWPFGVTLQSDTGGRLVSGWLDWGGEDRGPLSAYLDEILRKGLPDLPS